MMRSTTFPASAHHRIAGVAGALLSLGRVRKVFGDVEVFRLSAAIAQPTKDEWMPQSHAGSSVRAGRQWTASVLVALLIAGCARSSEQAAPAESGVPAPRTSVAASSGAAPANGKSIFLTGRDMQGAHITAHPAPLMPSCAACHHTDGSGGVHLPGGVVSADLRYRALVTAQKPPYTIALLERAISNGVDNTGQHLSPVMPRWQMSKRDLHDVAQYVLTALK